MTKFLITGARAPVALELARNLHKYNQKVVLADSLTYPLARNSKVIDQFYKIRSPREGIKKYQQSLLDIIEAESIDYLIPTCEEVFYIAFIKSTLSRSCEIFCPDFEFISQLHSKFKILELSSGTGVVLPETTLVDKKTLIAMKNFDDKIVKQEYCRFGTGVWLSPTSKMIKKQVKDLNGHFLVQEKIQGVEYCAYAVACNGVVYAEAIYEPTHRAKIAAGIYFKPITNAEVSGFVRIFCQKHCYTGQISFDLILNDSGIYILECNPRSTSGMHLLKDANLSKAITGTTTYSNNKYQQSRMIGLAMVLIGLPLSIMNRRFKDWVMDFNAASDVIKNKQDKKFFLFQFLSLAELLLISIKRRISLREAATADIEWDGEKIN